MRRFLQKGFSEKYGLKYGILNIGIKHENNGGKVRTDKKATEGSSIKHLQK